MAEKKDQEQIALQFLLAEYSELNEEFRRLREEGVTRLNFYITITSSILAGLVLLSQISPASSGFLQFAAIGAAFLLMLIGWSLFRYTIARDELTDDTLRALARLRRFFTNHAPSIKGVLSRPMDDEPTMFVTRNASSIRLTVQSILSLLFALMAGLAVNLVSRTLVLSVGIGVIAFASVMLSLEAYSKKQFKRITESAHKSVRFPREHNQQNRQNAA